MSNKTTTSVRVARVKDVLKFLYTTLDIFEGVLQVHEDAELYEDCAEILKEVNDIKKEIHKYQTYKLIEDETGRRIKVTELPDYFRLPDDNKTK